MEEKRSKNKMAWKKRKEDAFPDEDEEYHKETNEDEEEVLPEIKSKEKPRREISKEEIADMIKGHLMRAIQLVEIYSTL